jgi:hypothetical protein
LLIYFANTNTGICIGTLDIGIGLSVSVIGLIDIGCIDIGHIGIGKISVKRLRYQPKYRLISAFSPIIGQILA